MNKDNNFGRLLLLLLLAFGICLGLYYLPDQLFGMKIKKVDLLSDLRIKPESLSMDSLRMQLEQPDTVRIDSAAVRDSILKTTGIDSVALALRDSLYKVMYADKGADSLGTRIEDYSVGHIGLKRFFAALRNSRQANRPPFWVIRLSKVTLWWLISVRVCRSGSEDAESVSFRLRR